MTTGSLFGLQDRDVELHINVHPDCWKQLLGTAFCALCHALRNDSVYPTPIDIRVNALPAEYPIGSTSQWPIGIVRKDIRERLLPWLNDYSFGNCFNWHGERISTHYTMYAPQPINYRHKSVRAYRQCQVCGNIWVRGGIGRKHFLETDLSGRGVVQTRSGMTFVTKEVVASAGLRHVSDLELVEYALLSEPVDGFKLPGDPQEWEGRPAEPGYWED